MKIIGITGGVGSGKSSILKFLNENTTSKIVVADQIGAELCAAGALCYQPLIDLLGEKILGANTDIDRGRLAYEIFTNEETRKQVNAIIHPAVKNEILDIITKCRKYDLVEYVFIEAALLIEDGYKEIVDEMWYVYCEDEVRIKRLMENRGYSEGKARIIMAAQMKDAQYRANSDFVIDNSGAPEEAFKQISARLFL